jgi:hypothetical protein
MPYSLLGKTDVDDLEDDTGSEVRSRDSREGENKIWLRNSMRMMMGILPAASSVLIVTLCLLLIIDITMRLHQGASGNPWNIQSTYGKDTDYMSLDHRFDYLWNDELRATSALINLPLNINIPSNMKGYSQGAIGMFVLMRDIMLFSANCG